MRFEVLEHPADIGFRAFGASLSEVFASSAIALLSIAYEREAIEPREEYPFSAAAADRESLLVNFLNEVLYLADGRRIAISRIEIAELNEEHVRAAALGEPRDPQRHAAKVIVKAVTYHQLRLEATGSGWVAEVYLDI